jgi:hypothetical protein
VEVDVQLKAAPEPLDDRDGTAAPVAHAPAVDAAVIEAENGADGHREYRAAELVVVGEDVAEAVGQREDPLAHGNVRQHGIDEVGCALRHAPPATARTEAASLAGERDEALEGAGLAPDAREAASEDAAREEVAELPFDERREAGAIGPGRDLRAEGFEVIADDAMEDGVSLLPFSAASRRPRYSVRTLPSVGGAWCPEPLPDGATNSSLPSPTRSATISPSEGNSATSMQSPVTLPAGLRQETTK